MRKLRLGRGDIWPDLVLISDIDFGRRYGKAYRPICPNVHVWSTVRVFPARESGTRHIRVKFHQDISSMVGVKAGTRNPNGRTSVTLYAPGIFNAGA